jgi:predicted nucleic acid-binding protein
LTPVFLDTVGLVAAWDASDQWHVPAARALARCAEEGVPTVTSALVLLECGNAAARRPYRSSVAKLYAQMQGSGKLIVPTDEDLRLGWERYGTQPPGGPGIVDQISFIVMSRLGITRAFTNDQHFRRAGFEVLF